MTPPADQPEGPVRAARRGPRLPLRVTLVALLMGLLVVALTATGVTASWLLKGYLQGQQDSQLRDELASVASWHERAGRQPQWWSGPCTGNAFGFAGGEGLPSGSYLVAFLCPGAPEPLVLFRPSDRGTDPPPLDGAVLSDARAGDGAPITVLAEDGTEWRMAGTTLANGSTAVVALDAQRDERVIGRLVALQVLVGLVVLTVLGAAGYVLVRNSLRPLGDVERTAAAIAGGDLSRRVPAGDDRTEVGRLSAALNGMLARIESSFRAQQASEEHARGSAERMRRFVADASHELRTPLTSIRGFAELYRQGAVREDDEVRRLMERIEAEGSRMGVLVEDLLTLARLDQQRPLSIAPVDLAEVAGDAVHDARALQPDRPVELHVSSWLTELPVVLGDEARLRQVLGNLVTNALTHTPPTARITVSVSEDAGDPDTVVLAVADQGPGMTAADAERVFERFYRADTSRTRQAGGTGLGLAIVASLVAAHGGTVELTTAVGRGATFTVRLPRSGPAPGDAPGDAPGEGPGGPA